jgi:hypothetical protein
MALYIDDKDHHIEWHIGQEVPRFQSRVITFQADGHELDVIVDALRDHGKPCPLCKYAHTGDCATI